MLDGLPKFAVIISEQSLKVFSLSTLSFKIASRDKVHVCMIGPTFSLLMKQHSQEFTFAELHYIMSLSLPLGTERGTL